MQVHVGEQRRNHCSLRRSYLRLRPLTVFRNSRLQPFLDQAKYPAIGHAMRDELHDPLVAHVVEEATNVRIEHPVHSLPLNARRQRVQRLVRATVLAAIGLQLLLPARLTVGPAWLIPAFEGALLIGMFMATPRQLEQEHPRRRRVALGLTALVSAANIFSLSALTHYLLRHSTPSPRELIVAGVLIWLTNFLI